MAKVKFMYPVADVCGKIDKSSRVIFAHRGNSKYTMYQGTRTTPVTANELAQRSKFAEVVKNTRARMQDPTQLAADQIAFAAQSEFKSLYQYVFNQEWMA